MLSSLIVVDNSDPFRKRCFDALRDECGVVFEWHLATLCRTEIDLYPKGTWLCRISLQPHHIRLRWRTVELGDSREYYFLFNENHDRMPILPMGNDADWILRANRHYGLQLTTNLPKNKFEREDVLKKRVIDYLHFFYLFSLFDDFKGRTTRFRVPRDIEDFELEETEMIKMSLDPAIERGKLVGALWRFSDAGQRTEVEPAFGTIRRLIGFYSADVPMQVENSLWRLRVRLSLRTGFVSLYGSLPFYFSHVLRRPSDVSFPILPVPSGLYWSEPLLLINPRIRAAILGLLYFAVLIAWLVAGAIVLAYPFKYILNPALIDMFAKVFPIGVELTSGIIKWCAVYFVGVFSIFSIFIFQFDGVLTQAKKVAPGLLRIIYSSLDDWQRWMWDQFKMNLDTPIRKARTSLLWLLVSTILLVLSFTTLQVNDDPGRLRVEGVEVLGTFVGYSTLAIPGLPYLLGFIGIDTLKLIKEPLVTQSIVVVFRGLMFVVVVRSLWKLLGHTTPRILYESSRRLHHEMAKRIKNNDNK